MHTDGSEGGGGVSEARQAGVHGFRARRGAAPRNDHPESPYQTRVHGSAEIGFVRRGGGTRLAHLYQHDPLRVLFPAADGDPAALAVIATTSGGLVAGDRLALAVDAGPGVVAHVTGSAAEKVYRSTGLTTEIRQRLSVEPGGWLEYLPPEAILFDGARLRRDTTVHLAAGAGFLGGGIVVFGRRARGEAFTRGLLREVWEIQRDGELVWGDALHIDGDVTAVMADPACFDRAGACATLILAPPDGEPRRFLDEARAVQDRAADLRADVTAVNGLLVARWLGEPFVLRRAYADLACHLRQAAMGLPARLPRLWHV